MTDVSAESLGDSVSMFAPSFEPTFEPALEPGFEPAFAMAGEEMESLDAEAMWGYSVEPGHQDVHDALQSADETRLLRAAHDQGIPRLNDAEAIHDQIDPNVAGSPFLQTALSEAVASLSMAPAAAPAQPAAPAPESKQEPKKSPKGVFKAIGFGSIALLIGVGGWFATSSVKASEDPVLVVPETFATLPAVTPIIEPEVDTAVEPATLETTVAPPVEPAFTPIGTAVPVTTIAEEFVQQAPDTAVFSEPVGSVPSDSVFDDAVQVVTSGAAIP